MIDISTGKAMTRRDFGRGLAGILAAGVAPSLCAAVTGGYRRGLGMRLGAMGGEEALPYDRRLLYIGTTSHQTAPINPYIKIATSSFNTGLDFEFTFDIEFPSTPTRSYVGSGFSWSGQTQAFVAINSNSATGLYCDVSSSLDNLKTNISGKNARHKLTAIGNGGAIKYYDGETLIWNGTTAAFTIPSFGLFVMASNGTFPTQGRGDQKIFGFKMITQDLSVDLIPVLATFDGVQEPCFYNRFYDGNQSHGLKFYRNAGTAGNFYYA